MNLAQQQIVASLLMIDCGAIHRSESVPTQTTTFLSPPSMAGSTFESLGLPRWLTQQAASIRLTSPTAVQRSCIPEILKGKHVIGGAVTGSGKTAAFALPILAELGTDCYGVFAIVITPSRELAYQINDQFLAFGAPLGIRTAIIIGGVSHSRQLAAVTGANGGRPHILVATPGRLRFLFESFEEEMLQCVKYLRFIVLDEADRLLLEDGSGGGSAAAGPSRPRAIGSSKPTGAEEEQEQEEEEENDAVQPAHSMRDDVITLIGDLLPEQTLAPKGLQVLCFSATVPAILTDVKQSLLPSIGIRDASTLFVSTTQPDGAPSCPDGETSAYKLPASITQRYLFAPNDLKLHYLVLLLRTQPASASILVFTNSCLRCEIVRMSLQLLGFPVCSLNSLLTQPQRLDSLALFKAGLAKVLVATDVASRGLDIPSVSVVVHYDFPKIAATYVHRAGRTGRLSTVSSDGVEKKGLSVALVTDHDLYLVHKLERRLKTRLRKFFHEDRRGGAEDGDDEEAEEDEEEEEAVQPTKAGKGKAGKAAAKKAAEAKKAAAEAAATKKKQAASKLKKQRRTNPFSDEALLGVLDEVSQAKVEAKLNVAKRMGERAQRNKEESEGRKSELNRAIRRDGNSGRSRTTDAPANADRKRQRSAEDAPARRAPPKKTTPPTR